MKINSSLIYLSILVISELIAQFFLKKQTEILDNNNYLLLGIIFYIIVAIYFHKVLKTGKKLGILNSLFNALSTIGVIIIGYLAFGEKINHNQLLGIILISIGIVLIES